MTAPTTTTAPQKASAPLVDFGFGEPQAAASPASVKAKSTFDEWDSWGRTTREETPETTAASPPKATAPTAHPAPTTAAARHQKTPSEIPAVAAALGDGNEGGFFDDFDADPFAAAASPPPHLPQQDDLQPTPAREKQNRASRGRTNFMLSSRIEGRDSPTQLKAGLLEDYSSELFFYSAHRASVNDNTRFRECCR